MKNKTFHAEDHVTVGVPGKVEHVVDARFDGATSFVEHPDTALDRFGLVVDHLMDAAQHRLVIGLNPVQFKK